MNIAKSLSTPILKNVCVRLLLDVKWIKDLQTTESKSLYSFERRKKEGFK